LITPNTSAVAVCCSSASRLGQQPRIFHRDDRLRRKVLQQRDLLVRERPYLLSVNHESAEQRAVLSQRDPQPSARPAHISKRPPDGIARAVTFLSCDVRNMNEVLTLHQPIERNSGTWTPRLALPGLGKRRRDAAHGGGVERLAIEARQETELGLAQPHRLFEHRVEHWGEIAGRAVDDPQYLRRRGLLVERFRQFGGAVFDLLFEVGVGALQVCGHPVEALRQLFELIAGMDRDAVVERPGADPRGASVELADRSGHASGEQEAREDRDDKPEDEQQTGVQHRGVERRQRLADRLLNKDEPAELRDRRRGAQYPVAIEIADDRRRLGVGRRRVARRGYLRQSREVGIAQDAADIRMRDQPAFAVDDIGVAALTDLDGGDDVPDQLEIDFGDRYARIAAALRHCHCHVRLRFLTEIDGSEPQLLGQRLGKARIGRVIGTSANHIHRQTGDLELLVALTVELDQLRDRRYLPLQSAIIEAALIDR